MDKKKKIEFLLLEKLELIQSTESYKGTISLHLDVYTQILDILDSDNAQLTLLLDELRQESLTNNQLKLKSNS